MFPLVANPDQSARVIDLCDKTSTLKADFPGYTELPADQFASLPSLQIASP